MAIDVAVRNKGRLFLLAAGIGVLVGVSTAAFVALIGAFQLAFYGRASEAYFASIAGSLPGWRTVLALAGGGLLLGLVLQFLVPGRRYHGVADVMEACALRGARMDPRSGLSTALASALSLGAGASVGREGPAVHIGASLSAWLAERLGLSQRDSLTLLGCGAAAAVTASFNAPIAGVLFALEVVVGYYSLSVFAPVVVASMGAVMVTRQLLGDAPAFSVPDYQIASLWELPAFALMGIGGALIALALIRATALVQRLWTWLRLPLCLRPACGGALLGLIAVQFPEVLSVGYQAIDLALKGEMLFGLLLALLVAKLAATALALGSGFAGGVFSPALFLGAMFGGASWSLTSALFPELASTQGAYAIIGMAGVASAMLGAPISTLLIVFELTLDYHLTVAVMLAAAAASTAMQATGSCSFFRWQLAQRGIDIVAGRDQGLLVASDIEALIERDCTRLPVQISLGEAQRHIAAAASATGSGVAVLVDDAGELRGSLSLEEVAAALHGARASVALATSDAALDVARGAQVCVPRHTSLNGALDAMREHGLSWLPVIEASEGDATLLGVIHRDRVLSACNALLREARAEESGLN